MSNPYQSPTESNDTDVATVIAGDVRAMQIITFALIQGAVVIWAIMMFLSKADLSGSPDLLAWIGLGFAAIVFMVHLVVPRLMLKHNLQGLRNDSYRELSFSERAKCVYATLRSPHLIACALLEGAAVFNAVAYMIEHWIGNVLAGAVLIGLLIIRFPTATTMSFKVQNLMRTIETGHLPSPTQ